MACKIELVTSLCYSTEGNILLRFFKIYITVLFYQYNTITKNEDSIQKCKTTVWEISFLIININCHIIFLQVPGHTLDFSSGMILYFNK